jgi:hypothetical protein
MAVTNGLSLQQVWLLSSFNAFSPQRRKVREETSRQKTIKQLCVLCDFAVSLFTLRLETGQDT